MHAKKALLKKILCVYLILVGVSFSFFYIYNLRILGMLVSLWPTMVVLLVSIIQIHSGYKGLKSEGDSSYLYQQIAFIIQAVSIKILGLTFENSFGPAISIGFTDTPSLDYIVILRFFGMYLNNGYKINSDEISIVVNLFPILLCYLISIKTEENKILHSDQVRID
ncbi:MAG: hypothetical protein GXC73_16715 [Chitinophagaceae bacterium]|nr:hypothetical protein [Chitinophagaceae bacterium]